MLQSAIEHLLVKEHRKKEEERMEAEFKRRLMDKFAADERLEQFNQQRRRNREIELKREVNKFC